MADQTTSGDVITAVQEDHAQIKQLMAQMETATATQKRDVWERLLTKLAVHETAEEEVVHPLARRAPQGYQIVEGRLREEDKGKKALAELEKIGVDAPEFDREFAKVRSEILSHAEHEETQEHPQLRQSVDEQTLQRAATMFRRAEKMAPTHPHASSPESASGNMLVGGFVAVADRVRDALRDANRTSS